MTNTDTQTFGAILRAAREAAGKTLKETGAALGVSTSYVSDWETGYRAPPASDVLPHLATFLGVDLRALVEARARWYGHTEVPLTGNRAADKRASALAVAALQKGS